jgi:DNA-binding MarR family transcriptional regulator
VTRAPAPAPIRCIVSTVWFGATEPSASTEGTIAITSTDPAVVIEELIAAFDDLSALLMNNHAPEFLEIDVTMPQAKVLYLLAAAGDLHMADLVARLGVSLSTVSGLVDRLVDHGLAYRREDRIDRRQVVVGLTLAGKGFIDRFRELNARQMRELLGLLDETELDHVRRALAALERVAANLTRPYQRDVPRPSGTPGKDPA